MGTNFYTGKSNSIFVGKRSSAGNYCWDCGTTLCIGGNKKVHLGCTCEDKKDINSRLGCKKHWHKKCPICGKNPIDESLENSTGGRELGFNKNTPRKKTGVSSCSSFSWAIDFDKLRKSKVFKDEYKKRYTRKEFLKVLDECPIQSEDMIGKEFS